MLEREFPKTDRQRAASCGLAVAAAPRVLAAPRTSVRTSAAPVERRLVTHRASDGTDQDGTVINRLPLAHTSARGAARRRIASASSLHRFLRPLLHA